MRNAVPVFPSACGREGSTMAILDFVREEHSYADLSKRRRLFLLILVSVGSSAIYTPIYLKSVFL